MSGEEFDPLVAFFDGMARTQWLSAIHDQLKEKTGSWRNKKILDVGCGTGRLLARGVNEAQSLSGVDLSKQMVLAAREILVGAGAAAYSNVQEADAYALPFDGKSFDVVLSTCVMFLLPEPEKGLKEMARVVRSGGVLGMLNPTHLMNPAQAARFCETHQINGFEQKTMLQWSNVSTRRHRYDASELSSILQSLGANRITHHPVLDGLALITVARLYNEGTGNLSMK